MGEEGEQETTSHDDERPHSVLREGEISHAEVNAALLVWGISVTLVKSDDLLVFRHVREHQSFHTGRSSIFTSIIRSTTPSSATTSWT